MGRNATRTDDLGVDEGQGDDVEGVEAGHLLPVDTRNVSQRKEGLAPEVVLEHQVVVHDGEHQHGTSVSALAR